MCEVHVHPTRRRWQSVPPHFGTVATSTTGRRSSTNIGSWSLPDTMVTPSRRRTRTNSTASARGGVRPARAHSRGANAPHHHGQGAPIDASTAPSRLGSEYRRPGALLVLNTHPILCHPKAWGEGGGTVPSHINAAPTALSSASHYSRCLLTATSDSTV
jgi:hypothetical protein